MTDRIPDLFRHYKGGRYRKLFDSAVKAMGLNTSTELFEARHSDDGRTVHIVIDDCENVWVIDPQFSPIDGCRSAPRIVVYVSLDHGSIWVRPQAEFEGTVDLATLPMHYKRVTAHDAKGSLPHRVVRRFEPVDSFEE